jgi:molybdenum cofactor cytidylyltransferase
MAQVAAIVLAAGASSCFGYPEQLIRLGSETLLTLRGDAGAREFLKAAQTIDLPRGELDIDTIEDLDRARKLYET